MRKSQSSRMRWRYLTAGILLVIATMSGGSAVAHDYQKNSNGNKAAKVVKSAAAKHKLKHKKNHDKRQHWRAGTRPTSKPTAPTTSTPTTPTTPEPSTPAPSTPAPSTPAPTTPQTGFPNSSNTGVPAGTKLTAYSGPCTITANNTVIDAKTITCNLNIRASGVKISNSKITGTVATGENTSGYSFTISDSDVDAGQRENTGVGAVNFTALRIEVIGGNRSIHCYKNCTVEDSYVHGQFTDKTGKTHESGIRMGQSAIIRHNTITCDAPDVPPDAGCSAGLTGYGDFAPVQNNLIDGNLFLAGTGGYCVYGGSSGGKPYSTQAKNIVFTSNVWESGGKSSRPSCYYGPVTAFDSKAPGNVWQDNTFDNGKVVQPAN